MRNHRVAHTTADFVSGNVTLYRPNLDELKALCNALNLLLDALSFNAEPMRLPIPYHPNVVHTVGSDPKTDIEKILDSVAKDKSSAEYARKVS